MPRTSTSKLRDEARAEKQALIESGAYIPEEDEDEVVKPVKKQVKEKGFKDSDLIECVSVTVGKLIMIGIKSGEKYVWDGINSTNLVEYRDLIAAIRKHTPILFKPRIIIKNKDFLSQNPELEMLYGSLYTAEDFEQILDLPADKLREIIGQLPQGAKDTLLGIAVSKVDRGQLDSIQRIKVIDEIYGTSLLLKVTQ